MLNTKKCSKNDLSKFYNCYPIFKKYCLYNLWSEEYGELYKVKYCDIYVYSYTYNFIENYISQYFGYTFLYTLYNSPYFIKNIKSVFIKHIDYHFLLFFQYNLFLYSNISNKEIELFVEEYFYRYIKKNFEEELSRCVVKSFNEFIPACFLYCINTRLKLFNRKILKRQLHNPSILKSKVLSKNFIYNKTTELPRFFNLKPISYKSRCTSIIYFCVPFFSLPSVVKYFPYACCLLLKKGYNEKLGNTFRFRLVSKKKKYKCDRCWFFIRCRYAFFINVLKKNVGDISLFLNSTIEGFKDYDYKKNDVGIPTHSNNIIKENVSFVNSPIKTLPNLLTILDNKFSKYGSKLNKILLNTFLAPYYNPKKLSFIKVLDMNCSNVNYKKKDFFFVCSKYTLSEKIFKDNPKKTISLFDKIFQNELYNIQRPLKIFVIKYYFFNNKAFKYILLSSDQEIEYKFYE